MADSVEEHRRSGKSPVRNDHHQIPGPALTISHPSHRPPRAHAASRPRGDAGEILQDDAREMNGISSTRAPGLSLGPRNARWLRSLLHPHCAAPIPADANRNRQAEIGPSPAFPNGGNKGALPAWPKIEFLERIEQLCDCIEKSRLCWRGKQAEFDPKHIKQAIWANAFPEQAFTGTWQLCQTEGLNG